MSDTRMRSYRDALRVRLLRRMGHAMQHDLKSPVQGIYWSLELARRASSRRAASTRRRATRSRRRCRWRARSSRASSAPRATFLADAGIADEGEARFDLARARARDGAPFRHRGRDAQRAPHGRRAGRAGLRARRRARRSRRRCSPACCTRSTRCPPAGIAEVFVRPRERPRGGGDHRRCARRRRVRTTSSGLGTLGMRIAKSFVESRGGDFCLEARATTEAAR